MTGSQESDIGESPDRQKMFRVLQAMVKFGVELNTTEAKNGIPPLHMACIAGNIKLAEYLIEVGALVEYFSFENATREDKSPMMYCAKFGFIEIIALLLRFGALMETGDSTGKTALHHAGMWGQTRCAVFLLRCGLDKRIKDDKKQTAGLLAEDLGYTVTSQAIMTFAVMSYKAQFALEYFQRREEEANEPAGMEDLLGGGLDMLGNAGEAAMDAMKDAGKAIFSMGKSLMNWMGGKKEDKPEKVDADDVFAM